MHKKVSYAINRPPSTFSTSAHSTFRFILVFCVYGLFHSWQKEQLLNHFYFQKLFLSEFFSISFVIVITLEFIKTIENIHRYFVHRIPVNKRTKNERFRWGALVRYRNVVTRIVYSALTNSPWTKFKTSARKISPYGGDFIVPCYSRKNCTHGVWQITT